MTISGPTPLKVLDLPDDLLRLLLSRRYLPPSALIELACASKAAVHAALPGLYTDLLVPSIAALPLIYATLQARPDLAQHVRSVTASRYFVLSYQFQGHEQSIHESRMCPGSPIVSISTAVKRCGLDVLNSELPMPWFARIAQMCPQLTTVDMGDMDRMQFDAKSIMFGLVDLARILRSRRGQLRCKSWPISCILVKDRLVRHQDFPASTAPFVPDVYLVDSVDWSRKQVGVTDAFCIDLGRQTLSTHFCLVPFRDLVPMEDQANWSIGTADLRLFNAKQGILEQGFWVGSSWLTSKKELWLKGGLAHGQDRVFDFSQPGLVKGNINLALPLADLASDPSSSIRANTEQQCDHILMDGPDMPSVPFAQWESVIASAMHYYKKIPLQPFSYVSTLTLLGASFVKQVTLAPFMSILASGVPNLVRLELRRVSSPIDLILNHADALIRRGHHLGTRLQELTVASYVPDFMNDDPYPFIGTSSPADALLAAPGNRLTPLETAGPDRVQLASLTLQLDGPGSDCMDSRRAATVSIHPTILRNLKSLRVDCVRLFLPSPHFARPDSPSFLPLAHAIRKGGRVIQLDNTITLPNLESLRISSTALNGSNRCVHAHEGSPVPRDLPHMPSLRHFVLSLDPIHEQTKIITTAIVAPILRRYPRLECARFLHMTCVGTAAQRARAIHAEFFAPYPRELAPCPRLRVVLVNNEEPIEYYQWLRKKGGARVDSGVKKLPLSKVAVE